MHVEQDIESACWNLMGTLKDAPVGTAEALRQEFRTWGDMERVLTKQL